MWNLTRTSPLSKYIANISKREETYVRKPSYGGGTSHVHAAGVHHYRWHGTRMSSLSQATSGTTVSQESRGLLDYDVLDKNQNLICLSENIPPVLKAIAFNKESKSQLKEIDFDIERGLFFLTDVKVQISF